jgi:hypothetical protein
VLTLFTTPVIYIFFDNLGRRLSRAHANGSDLPAPNPSQA